MRESVQNKCDLLIKNKELIEKEFKWESALKVICAALVFTGAKAEADPERLKECRTILKKNAGMLSTMRAEVEPVVVSRMALSNDPQKYYDDVKMVYDKVTKGDIFDNGFLVQAAMSIVDAGRKDDADEITARYKELYKKMSKEHPFLTGSEDIVFAMLLAMTDKPIDQIISDMEECYNYLKKELKIKVSANEIQGLGEVLALTDGSITEKCDKVAVLYKTFAEHKMPYGTSYNEFASLGSLIDIPVDPDILVDEIIETAEYLKSGKGFGGWTLDKKQRLMFAAMLVGDIYEVDQVMTGASAMSSTIAMVIAEELAVMVCIMAATTATTSH